MKYFILILAIFNSLSFICAKDATAPDYDIDITEIKLREKQNTGRDKSISIASVDAWIYDCTDQISVIAAGSIISNEEKDRILFFDAIDDLAEVYDYSLNLLKVITGPDDIRPEYLFPDEDHPIAIQLGEYCDTYLFGVCGSDEDVFAAYQGRIEGDNTGTYIFHFDWDGKFQAIYYVDGTIYGNLSASVDGRILYASVLDSCGSQQFCQYNIPN